ncbi:MAG: hypothetical protein ACI9U2_005193, partial [Bradymonadia bacterium]
MIEALREYAAAGGFVMPPLMIATVVLWYALGLRIFAVRQGPVIRRATDQAQAVFGRGTQDLDPRIEAAFSGERRELSKGRMLIRS